MGSGVVMSQLYGQGDREGLRRAMGNAFVGIALAALALAAAAFALLDSLMVWMRVPAEAVEDLRGYLQIIFWGIGFTFLYNFFATALRSVGNSAAALWFLLCAAVMNIALDLWFVTGLGWGVEGAALATVIAQAASAAGIVVYSLLKMGDLRPGIRHLRPDGPLIRRIAVVSVLTGAQQSIMNFGILMIQSLVNSFGVNVMAAFAAGVKIRRVRLRARTGLCQRVRHFCGAECRRRPRRPGAAGPSGSGRDVPGLLCAGIGGGGDLCRAAAEHLH